MLKGVCGLARPKTDKYNIAVMVEKIEEYIASVLGSDAEGEYRVPILKECCLIYGWKYDYVMELKAKEKNEALTQAIKRLLDWKEVRLERGSLTGKINNTFGIFSLKQLGWTDRQIVEHSGVVDFKLPDLVKKYAE